MHQRTLLRPDFITMVEAAQPGEQIVYHTGSLMKDRLFGSQFLRVFAVAAAAWDAMERGEVHLAQRRVRDGYEYVAIKKVKPYKAAEWTGCYRATHPVKLRVKEAA